VAKYNATKMAATQGRLRNSADLAHSDPLLAWAKAGFNEKAMIVADQTDRNLLKLIDPPGFGFAYLEPPSVNRKTGEGAKRAVSPGTTSLGSRRAFSAPLLNKAQAVQGNYHSPAFFSETGCSPSHEGYNLRHYLTRKHLLRGVST
jgi:hypothetical protein